MIMLSLSQQGGEMKNKNEYCAEVELDRGSSLTAVSYDRTQHAVVAAGRATVGGKAVVAEITGIATGKSREGTVNLWLPGFSFRGSDGDVTQVPGFNAVAVLAPRQGAISTAKVIAAYVNTARTSYKAKASGDRKTAWITIAFTGQNCRKHPYYALA